MRGGGKGGRERIWAVCSRRARNLGDLGGGAPAGAADARASSPGRGELGGARRTGAGPGEQGRGLAAQKPAGGAGRHVREEGRAACAASVRAAPASRAVVYQHTCVLFLRWNVGLARVGPPASAEGRGEVRPARCGLPERSLVKQARLAGSALPA